MTARRHLAIIQDVSARDSRSASRTAGTEDIVPHRSAGTWFALSTLVVIALWLPLGMLGLWFSRLGVLGLDWLERSMGATAAVIHPTRTGIALVPILASFSIAAAVGGAVVAKFGPPRKVMRDAMVGAVAGLVVATLAAVEGALRPWQLGVTAYVTLVTIGAASAYFGGRLGRRSRDAASLGHPRPSLKEHS